MPLLCALKKAEGGCDLTHTHTLQFVLPLFLHELLLCLIIMLTHPLSSPPPLCFSTQMTHLPSAEKSFPAGGVSFVYLALLCLHS